MTWLANALFAFGTVSFIVSLIKLVRLTRCTTVTKPLCTWSTDQLRAARINKQGRIVSQLRGELVVDVGPLSHWRVTDYMRGDLHRFPDGCRTYVSDTGMLVVDHRGVDVTEWAIRPLFTLYTHCPSCDFQAVHFLLGQSQEEDDPGRPTMTRSCVHCTHVWRERMGT